jgi:hypothetical protein
MALMWRCVMAFILAALPSLLALAPAEASDTGPVIVIPSRPGVPIIIYGRDASYAVVEGDWGLARPGAVPVTVFGGSPVLPSPVYSRHNSYHPRYGRTPLRGRNEIEPPPDRALPEPAEDFSRSWSTSSDAIPVSDGPASGGELPYDADHSENSPNTDRQRSSNGNRPGRIERRHRHRFRH